MGREPPKPAVEGSPPHTLGQMANIKVPGYDNQTRFPPTKKISWNVFCSRQRTRPSSSGLCGTSPIGTYSCCRGSARRPPSLVRRSEQETISTTENFVTKKTMIGLFCRFPCNTRGRMAEVQFFLPNTRSFQMRLRRMLTIT